MLVTLIQQGVLGTPLAIRDLRSKERTWYGEKPFQYTYSNSTKSALPWTPEYSGKRLPRNSGSKDSDKDENIHVKHTYTTARLQQEIRSSWPSAFQHSDHLEHTKNTRRYTPCIWRTANESEVSLSNIRMSILQIHNKRLHSHVRTL